MGDSEGTSDVIDTNRLTKSGALTIEVDHEPDVMENWVCVVRGRSAPAAA
jgi:hypothetical protein